MIVKLQKKLGGFISDNEFISISEYQDGQGILRESNEDGILWMQFNTEYSQEDIDAVCSVFQLEQIQ